MSGYPGSKGASGVAEKIIAAFPSHDLYIEPFVGKSAVLRKKTASTSVVFDVAGLADYWRDYSHVTFLRKCGLEFLERVFLPPTALVYCDPPYPHETRTKKRLYEQEWSDRRHRRFLRACRRLACNVVISTYPNDVYSAELGDWFYFDFQAMTRGGVRTERVYCNYDPNAVAGCNDFLGVDYRDRWRLKKKARRQVARFQAMPDPEARFLLRQIIDRVAPDIVSPDLAMPARARNSDFDASRATPISALVRSAAPISAMPRPRST